MKIRGLLLALIVGTTIFFAAACDQVSIAKLSANPSKYNNREVGVIGRVIKSYGVDVPFTPVRGGVYEVDDGTGTIWVATQNSVPREGARIGVKGRFQDFGLRFGGKTYGGLGIVENDRRIK
jgi:hypothetical protein